MSKAIRIIAGLGNPEDKYERTLHNAGFWFVDALARKYGGNFRYEKKFDADYCRINLHGEDVWLVKPQSYMNCSGQPIRGVLDYYRLKASELLVAHDEIDLPPGTTIPAVVRGDKVIIAHHDTMILENDHVLLFVPDKRQIAAVERLFQVGVIFV